MPTVTESAESRVRAAARTIRAYAAADAQSPLIPTMIERRNPGPSDVAIDILFCGVCHSDLHQARSEWGPAMYPMVPGHEIVGRVREVGAAVKKFRPGDLAGVGCLVDSCGECDACRRDLQVFCAKGAAQTYNSTEMDRRTPTFGGYSNEIVVKEDFVLRIPETLDPAGAAPLLCAGVTTWAPLRQWNCKSGDHVAVVGLGGLGHVAVKLASSMGAHVTMLSHTRAKEADARRLGAEAFEATNDPATFTRLIGKFNLILDTRSVPHDYDPYLGMLATEGTMVLLGAPTQPMPLSAFSLILGNHRLAGSLIGGLRLTQEVLDYCGTHGITSDVEIIPMHKINEAYDRMLKSDVRYRFVIDMESLRR